LNNLVLISGRLGQFDKAFRFGQVVLRQYPGFSQIHLSLAAVYENRGEDDLALKHYRLFLKSSAPNNSLSQHVQARIDALNEAKP